MRTPSSFRTCALIVLALLPLAVFAQSTPDIAPAPVVGTDYVLIDGGQPWQPLQGKIEVVEIFAYSCSHCAAFEPVLSAWTARQPADVRVSYVPAAYDPQDSFGRAFFAAQRLGGLDSTHAALFRAVHDEQTVPPRNPSVDEIATFYRQHGVDVDKFRTVFAGGGVDADMQHAREFAVASGMEGTPTLVVDGKYRVRGSSHADALRIAAGLVVMERAAMRKPTPAP